MEATEDGLLEELEAGATVLTVNSRLARFLRRAFDLRQHRAGRRAWAAPEILSLDAWLRRCWNDAFDVLALSAALLDDPTSPGASSSAAGPAPGPVSRGRGRRAGRRPVPVAAAATEDLFSSAATFPPDGELSPGGSGGPDGPEGGRRAPRPDPAHPPLPTLLSASHEQVIWEGIISRSQEGHELLQIGPTARQARLAWALLRQWRLTLDRLVEPLPDDAAAFRRWAEEFRKLCAQHHWADEARLPDLVAGFFRDGLLTPPARLLGIGFDDPPPQFRELFEAAGCELVAPPAAPEPRRARRASFADTSAELEAAARWARALLENAAARTGSGAGDCAGGPLIAVVVPDLAERRAEVERVFADLLHPGMALPSVKTPPSRRLYNISLGYPLIQVPLIRSALLLLELAGAEEAPVERVSSALRSPFPSGFQEEQTSRALVDAALRKNGRLTTTLEEVRRACRRVGAAQCRELRRGLVVFWRTRRRNARQPEFRSPAAWASEFSQTLEELDWPFGRDPDSAEHQARNRWFGLLEQLASLDSVIDSGPEAERSGRISRSAALARLRQFASEAVFQPEGPSDAPVQILGLLEASAGMVFDHLWLAGLHDEAWPGPSHPNPFLPVEFQRRHQMPHASPDWELAFARRVTERLLESAPDVVVSYPEREGDRDLRPSPLIADLEQAVCAASGTREGLPRSAVPLLGDHLFAARALETVVDVPHVPMRDGELGRLRGGTRIFTDQAACPFRAFARHRLGARGLEPCTAGPAPADRGVMVHRALERLWGLIGSWEVLAGSTSEQLADLAESAARAAARESFRNPRSRLARLEVERLRRLLLEWLWIEKNRAPFTVVRRESERMVCFGGLTVKTVIDRVDRLADGSLVIIDYKTSRPDVRDWFGERPTEPQLPIYCASCDDSVDPDADGVEETASNVAAVAFAQIRTGEMRFHGITRSESPLLPGVEHYSQREEAACFPTWEDLVLAWNRELHSLGETFRDGHVRIAPKQGRDTCRNCDLAPLCRIHELAAGETDPDAEVEG